MDCPGGFYSPSNPCVIRTYRYHTRINLRFYFVLRCLIWGRQVTTILFVISPCLKASLWAKRGKGFTIFFVTKTTAGASFFGAAALKSIFGVWGTNSHPDNPLNTCVSQKNSDERVKGWNGNKNFTGTRSLPLPSRKNAVRLSQPPHQPTRRMLR